MVLIEKTPLGEFDLLEATLQHRVTENFYITAIIFLDLLKTCRGGGHKRWEGSETFLERKWVLRSFPEVS